MKKARKHCLTHYLLPAGTSMKLSLWYSFCIILVKNQTNLIELYTIVSYPSHFLYFIFDMESIMMRIRLPYKYCDTYKFCYEWDRPPQRVRSPVSNEMKIKGPTFWNEHIELSETKQKVECIQLDQIYRFRLWSEYAKKIKNLILHPKKKLESAEQHVPSHRQV